ncbi:hypothetical protein KZZ52_23380 [Dactylosporangium sp. AC04546]|uniref:hypothetical protein n=1 Tax=Dactylosporangium sp. AC04546 TaxID=2862460 RepID=UPI001EDD363D|nr:hypothetical protein [Dactylosporangium sp. AC04546]WVK88220.1 hypothetical protein KZZ52_23380 [Dactylosporangium sp. AC04546]
MDTTSQWTCAYCWTLVDPTKRGEGVFVEVHNGGKAGQTMAAHRQCFVKRLSPQLTLGPLLETPE